MPRPFVAWPMQIRTGIVMLRAADRRGAVQGMRGRAVRGIRSRLLLELDSWMPHPVNEKPNGFRVYRWRFFRNAW